jgi:hypothetical protein
MQPKIPLTPWFLFVSFFLLVFNLFEIISCGNTENTEDTCEPESCFGKCPPSTDGCGNECPDICSDSSQTCNGDTGRCVDFLDGPGGCFEVQGPPGISHYWPRGHDMGIVFLGDERTINVGFYNFCADYDAKVIDTFVLDEENGLGPSDDFEIVRSPAPGSTVSFYIDNIEISFKPTTTGWHRARFRYWVSHGYYDFDLVAEVIEAGTAVQKTETNCLEFEPLLTHRNATVGRSQTGYLEATATCETVFGESHVIMEAIELSGDTDVLSIDSAEVWNAFSSGPWGMQIGDVLAPVSVHFKPNTEGSFSASVTITTNEPDGHHEIAIQGETRN